MRVHYLVSNVRRYQLGLELLPPAPTGEPSAPPMIEPVPPVAPVIDPAPVAVVPAPVPEVAVPQPRWVNEGKHDLTPTLAAVGTVAVLAALGFALFK